MTKLKIVYEGPAENVKFLILTTILCLLGVIGIPFITIELGQKPIPPKPETITQKTNCPQGEPRGLIGVCNKSSN